ncbi:PDZ and LIM domain protein 5, partial [Anas platyrhynchos]
NYTVSLVGPAPWGFRLQGGKDFNMPLSISRLSDGGKAARAHVGIGDVVLTIDGISTDGMTHLEAQNKIKACTGNLNMTLQRARRSTPRIRTASTKKERRVIVVGDSVLRGTEGPICRPDPTRREVCCLPGARVRDVARKLPNLVRPSDYYPLLIIQAGTDDIDNRSLKAIKRDFRGLGRLVDGAGVQVVFSSVPTLTGRGTERTTKAHLLNTWLRGWCLRRNLGFFDHGAVYSAPGLVAVDGLEKYERTGVGGSQMGNREGRSQVSMLNDNLVTSSFLCVGMYMGLQFLGCSPPRKHIVDTYTEFYHTPTHSDASKKRLIEDTEDWHPRTGTTQSRSFRILAQITGTDHMKEPEHEAAKKTKRITPELPAPDSAILLPSAAGTEPPLPAKCSVATQTPEPPLPTPAAVQPPFAAPSMEATLVEPPHPASDSVEPTQPAAYTATSVRSMPASYESPDTRPSPNNTTSAAALKPTGPPSTAKYSGWQPANQTAPASGWTSNSIKPSGTTAPSQKFATPPQLTEQDTLVQRAEHIPAGKRTPMCAQCNQVIRGPFLVALGKSWHPEEFNCAHCKASMAYIGFVEEKGALYCEVCYEKFFAPECSKCQRKILGEVINALKQTWHVSCFVCVACHNPIRNNVFHLEDGDPYCETDYYALFGTMCHGCEFPIEAGDRFLEALGHTWHDTCFVCSV